MEPNNFLEEEIRNVCCIITLVASNEVDILKNRSTTTMIASFPLGIRERATMKSMLIVFPRLEGIERGV